MVPVLVGFNPVDLARNAAIQHVDYTFRHIAQRMKLAEKAFVINPVVGPVGLNSCACFFLVRLLSACVDMFNRRQSLVQQE